ncbi:ImuA family protein [Ancylobacter sp. G4_0304]|uniref:ImuA family protein n=1 Tax=Ancylobacter sp. G4_0304 TaxID=3114289 RepID=UPI0039C5F199
MRAAHDVSALRQMLAGLEAERLPGASSAFSLGATGPDSVLADTLARGALHEIYAAEGADMPAASGFALALALRSAQAEGEAPPYPRPIVWVRQDFLDSEAGRLDAHGLRDLGLDPSRLILVRARDPEQALRAAGDAVRCAALGAVLLEPWGEPKALDLTATRRLALRAGASGVTLFLLRMAAKPSASVAVTRWLVRPILSNPLPADAPGAPAFAVALLRHRGGLQGHDWNLEWDHESCSFRDIAPLSRPVVSVPAGKPARQDAGAQEAAGDVRPFRRAG